MNTGAVLALVCGVLVVLFAQKPDVTSLAIMIQPTAFLIVIGGTFCASLLNFNFATLKNAFRASNEVFYKSENRSDIVINEIIQLAYYARKNGLFALQNVLDRVSEPFLIRGIKLAIDINNPQLIYDLKYLMRKKKN